MMGLVFFPVSRAHYTILKSQGIMSVVAIIAIGSEYSGPNLPLIPMETYQG
jgi:hypothetical protein